MNAYRFGKGEDPTDEMLKQIMKEVAEEATARNQKATEERWAQLELDIKRNKSKWAARTKSVTNA